MNIIFYFCLFFLKQDTSSIQLVKLQYKMQSITSKHWVAAIIISATIAFYLIIIEPTYWAFIFDRQKIKKASVVGGDLEKDIKYFDGKKVFKLKNLNKEAVQEIDYDASHYISILESYDHQFDDEQKTHIIMKSLKQKKIIGATTTKNFASSFAAVFGVTYSIIHIFSFPINAPYNYIVNKYKYFKLKRITKEDISNKIKGNLIGRKKQVQTITNYVEQIISNPTLEKPILFLNGATGTGKTQIIKNLSNIITNFVMINGSEYALFNEANTNKFYYQLTLDNVLGVLLIDEFDKMSTEYQKMLLELLSEHSINILNPVKGRYDSICLSEYMIIVNLNNEEVYDTKDEKIIKKSFDKKYGRHFTSRANEILLFPVFDFNNLNHEQLQTMLCDYILNVKQNYKINLTIDASILHNVDSQYGVRNFIKTAIKEIEKLIILNKLKNCDCTVYCDAETSKYSIKINSDNIE